MLALKPAVFLGLICVLGEQMMAQYDVFTNPSHSAADGIPYVVVIQSDLLDALATRLTMPLAEPDALVKAPAMLCPVTALKVAQVQSVLSKDVAAHHGICKSAFILALTCSMTSVLTAAFFLARRIFQSRDFT